MTKRCAYELCGEEFEAKTHNMKYCSDEHCKLATNARIMRKYYESKARRKGAVRVCATPGCSTLLSRYNEKKVCAKCEAEAETQSRQKLLDMIKELEG